MAAIMVFPDLETMVAGVVVVPMIMKEFIRLVRVKAAGNVTLS